MNKNKGVFYFRPRNDMLVHSFGFGKENYFTDFMKGDNPFIYKYEYYTNIAFGGPRLIWDISADTYQYVIPSRINVCGCQNFDDNSFIVYYSFPKSIENSTEYNNLKNNILKTI